MTQVHRSSSLLFCFTASSSVAFLTEYTKLFQKTILGTEIRKTVSQKRDIFNDTMGYLSSLSPLTFLSSLRYTLPTIFFTFSKW